MIFFDTETTDLIRNPALPLDKQPHIIEIGIVGDDFEYSQLINPGIQISDTITKITGITNADLEDQPIFEDIYPDIEEIFAEAKGLCAHNMPFDKSMLKFELRRINKCSEFPWPKIQADTVQLARKHYKGRFMKMNNLYNDLFGETHTQNHRALDDAKMLRRVYHELMARG